MSRRQKRRKPMSEINVVPYIDVMLVLLVIFMITAPMIEQGVKIDLPQAQAEMMASDEKKLMLHINATRHVYLGKTFVPFSELADKLKYNERLQADKELYLKADRKLPYGLVVKVMALVKAAGIDKVGLVTEGGEDGDVGAETEVSEKDRPTP